MITIWKTPIVATVEQVLKDLKLQLYGAGLLKEIKNTGSDLMCTCPFHANGKEHNPSCGVLLQQKVAIMGSHISEDQCKELERTPFRRFVLATDNDDAGRKGASQIKRLLIPKGFRFINLKWHTSLNDLVKEYGDGWKDHLTGY